MNPRILIYGYGNPGRFDDGLGPEFVRRMGSQAIEGIAVENGYQLQIEDAAVIAAYDAVVFVDADTGCCDPFDLKRIEAFPGLAWTSHVVRPEVVLALAHRHFGCRTFGYTLGIRGERFEGFGEGLSPRAERNLAVALESVGRLLREGFFDPEITVPDSKR